MQCAFMQGFLYLLMCFFRGVVHPWFYLLAHPYTQMTTKVCSSNLCILTLKVGNYASWQ